MAAHVVVRMERALLAAHQQHAFPGHVDHAVVARLRQVSLACGAEPLAVEDRRAVCGEGLGGEIGGAYRASCSIPPVPSCRLLDTCLISGCGAPNRVSNPSSVPNPAWGQANRA